MDDSEHLFSEYLMTTFSLETAIEEVKTELAKCRLDLTDIRPLCPQSPGTVDG